MYRIEAIGVEFNSLESLNEFLKNELNELLDVLSVTQNRGFNSIRAFQIPMKEVQSMITDILINTSEPSLNDVDRVKNGLAKLSSGYKNQKIIYTKSLFYLCFLKHSEAFQLTKEEKGYIVLYYLDRASLIELMKSNSLVLSAYVRYLAIMNEVHRDQGRNADSSWTVGIENTVAVLNETLNKIEKDREKQKEELQKTLELNEKNGAVFAGKIKNFEDNSSQAINEFNSKKESSLSAIVAGISFKEAIKYSDEESTFSINRFKDYLLYSGFIVSIGIALLIGIFVLFAYIKYPVISKNTSVDAVNENFLVYYMKNFNSISFDSVLYLVILLLFIWFARITMKIAINSYNRSINYRERKVLMQSYISMLDSKHIVGESEKNVALISIFKNIAPSVDGDSHPHPLMELADLVKKKGQ